MGPSDRISSGILIDRSIASGNEVRSKAAPEGPRKATPPKPTKPAPNEPPPVTDDELDSLVRTKTEKLRPPEAALPGMSLSDFMLLKGEQGVQFGAEFNAAVAELTPGKAWPKYTDADRYALAVKLGMVKP